MKRLEAHLPIVWKNHGGTQSIVIHSSLRGIISEVTFECDDYDKYIEAASKALLKAGWRRLNKWTEEETSYVSKVDAR